MEGKIKIGDKLIQLGYITKSQLEQGRLLQKGTRKKIGDILVEQGIISSQILTDTLKELIDVENVELTVPNIMPEAIKKLPRNICTRHKILPYKLEGNQIYLAMEDPQNLEAIKDVKRISGMDVVVSIATIEDINNAIDKWYSSHDVDKVLREYISKEKRNIVEETISGDEDVNSAPIVKLVNSILESAVRKKASDIHIENDDNNMRVRFRIDGVLMEHLKTSSRAYKAVISRIKIISNLNISEKRLPQDGRIYREIDDKSIDFRVSTMPTSKDEKVVMRVLDRSSFMVDKQSLGLTSQGIQMYDKFLKRPYGLILVVGPTGSGKTTTLYSMLNQLNDVKKNILTIEDPVEYELDGVNQSQINYKAGLDFTKALRAFLRQDPDIIMVGEIRDHDTAEIAIRASLTGHLVLSTLHANSAVGAISRLSDMGIDNFLITSSLIGVVSQRLVRKICTECKHTYEASIGEKRMLGLNTDENLTLYKGYGCRTCNNTGYKGRIGIYELVEISNDVKKLVDQDMNEYEISKKIKDLGVKTIKDDAKIKVIEGVTTIDEMIRTTFVDE